jgi:hypothetical protein
MKLQLHVQTHQNNLNKNSGLGFYQSIGWAVAAYYLRDSPLSEMYFYHNDPLTQSEKVIFVGIH